MRKEIVIQPLLERYKCSLPSLVHSDCGNQYRLRNYQGLLTEKQMTHSMSHPGTPGMATLFRTIFLRCRFFITVISDNLQVAYSIGS